MGDIKKNGIWDTFLGQLAPSKVSDLVPFLENIQSVLELHYYESIAYWIAIIFI